MCILIYLTISMSLSLSFRTTLTPWKACAMTEWRDYSISHCTHSSLLWLSQPSSAPFPEPGGAFPGNLNYSCWFLLKVWMFFCDRFVEWLLWSILSRFFFCSKRGIMLYFPQSFAMIIQTYLCLLTTVTKNDLDIYRTEIQLQKNHLMSYPLFALEWCIGPSF